MMQTSRTMPEDFKNYEELVLSGNILVDVKTIVDDKGFIPLLIRKGENNQPLIWLKAKSKDGEIDLVEKNRSLINVIEVNLYKNKKSMDVVLNHNGDKYLLLEIDYKENIPSITNIDLRQLGYDIYGDDDSLTIGSSKMENNTFHTETMIGV